jgi:hypothetical protein
MLVLRLSNEIHHLTLAPHQCTPIVFFILKQHIYCKILPSLTFNRPKHYLHFHTLITNSIVLYSLSLYHCIYSEFQASIIILFCKSIDIVCNRTEIIGDVSVEMIPLRYC